MNRDRDTYELHFDDEDLLCPCQPKSPDVVRPIHTVAACKRWRAGGEFEPWQPRDVIDDEIEPDPLWS